MTYVISTVTLKGGVAKSIVTIGIAEFLAAMFNKRVLVIDLDPQTDATVALIGADRWRTLNSEGRTVSTLFHDALVARSQDAENEQDMESEPEDEFDHASTRQTSGIPRSHVHPVDLLHSVEEADDELEPQFDLYSTLQTDASPVPEVRTVDLLPSSLDLIEIQDRLPYVLGMQRPSDPRTVLLPNTELLATAVRPILGNYDYVLVDCPPGLGILTLNGLRISDCYITPVTPDSLSTYGIMDIEELVREFGEQVEHIVFIPNMAVVVTGYRADSSTHREALARLRADTRLLRVFDTVVPEGLETSSSADFVESTTLQLRYQNLGGDDAFRALTEEFRTVMETGL